LNFDPASHIRTRQCLSSLREKLPSYDVIIVGSGAAGGMSAYVLCKAGRNYDPIMETPMFQTNADAPLAGASTPDKHFGFFDATVGGGWTAPGEPYMVKREGANGGHEATDWKAIGYVGNLPMAEFSGPPPEVLKDLGLA
jgi:hypothetical protein